MAGVFAEARASIFGSAARQGERDAMAAAFECASTMFPWDRIAEDLLKEYERLF
jgi:hypothetical protein